MGTTMPAAALSAVRFNDLPTVTQLVDSGIRIQNPSVQLQSLCFRSLRNTVSDLSWFTVGLASLSTRWWILARFHLPCAGDPHEPKG